MKTSYKYSPIVIIDALWLKLYRITEITFLYPSGIVFPGYIMPYDLQYDANEFLILVDPACWHCLEIDESKLERPDYWGC